MEKEIDFNDIDEYIKNNEKNFDKLIVNNIPTNANISPNKFNELSNNINDKGNLILHYNNILQDSELKKIKMNLIFSGLINITINNNKNITCTKKNFNNNKININNFNPNSTQESNKDIELLIDPFNSDDNNNDNNYLVNAKPCEGCTCGRANNSNKVDLRTFKGCGRCHLGDGIRCKNCPFRGFPAFNVEDKIKVIDEFKNNNNINIERDHNNIKINPVNNTIKLDI